MIKRQIARLNKPASGKGAASGDEGGEGEGAAEASAAGNDQGAVARRLDKLEQLMQELNDRLKTIETRLPPPK
jgi:NADP-dependent 3-hydroxy acid dehydrogenase YdfG